MKCWGYQFSRQVYRISVYHIFHEASQFLPETASNRRKNFRIMMPDVGKRLGGSLSHITLHPTYGGSKNPRTNHYIDWFKWKYKKKNMFFPCFSYEIWTIWTCELTLQPIQETLVCVVHMLNKPVRIDNHHIITKGIILTNILGIITIQKGNLHQPTNFNGMTEGVLNTTQMGYSEPCCGRTKSCTSWYW